MAGSSDLRDGQAAGLAAERVRGDRAPTDHGLREWCLTLQADEPINIDAIDPEVVDEVREVLLTSHSDFVFHTEVWRGHALKLPRVPARPGPQSGRRHPGTRA